jgi:LacI family transcriptional regulator
MKDERKQTARQLADKIGVSASTLSRVLNHPELVKDETREAIVTKLETIGYPLHRYTKRKQRKTIGLTLSDPTTVFSMSLTSTTAALLSDTPYQLLVFDIGKRQNIKTYFSRHPDFLEKIDALLVSSAVVDAEDKKYFAGFGIPLALLQTRCEGEFSVHNNNFLGCQDAARYMLGRGYEKIAFVGWKPEDEHIGERYMGFASTLSAAGVPMPKEYHLSVPLSRKGGFEATDVLMHLPTPPEAIFYGCDDMAAGGFRYLRQHGFRIPRDIGIMGFDNTSIAEVIDLTTMDQSIELKCQIAVSHLLGRLGYADPSAYGTAREEMSITPKLITRTSLR